MEVGFWAENGGWWILITLDSESKMGVGVEKKSKNGKKRRKNEKKV